MEFKEGCNFGYGGAELYERLGTTSKEGFLLKKSPVLGLWKKRYVVLEEGTLRYFKNKADRLSGSPGKNMNLSPQSMTSFTPIENCFTIRQTDSLSMRVGAAKSTSKIRRTSLASTKSSEDSESSSAASQNAQWFFLTSDEIELHEWVTAISAHIHVVHMQNIRYPKNLEQRMKSGTASRLFYEAPTAASGEEHRLPIGIRTIPELTGPRTGDAIYPGEVFEVIFRFVNDAPSEGGPTNAFLQLAGDRGWIFENHPVTGEPLVSISERGSYKDRIAKYRYPTTNSGASIPVRCGPCLESRATGEVIDPSDDIITVKGVWTPKESDDGTISGVEFLKLNDIVGWIPNLGALTEVVDAPKTVAPSAGANKTYRRQSINIARRSVDIRQGGNRALASKDAMVSRRKSQLTLEEAVECL